MTNGDENAVARLAQLAALHRSVGRCGLVPADFEPIQEKLGDIGGEVENRAKLTAHLARANVPLMQRLMLLLKLAAGESAPLGPAANRARTEAIKLFRQDDTRAALAAAPEAMAQVRVLIQQAGMAA
jgi:hypothetical protein